MHKKTLNIIKNLGYEEDTIKIFKTNDKNHDSKNVLNSLRKLGFPEEAIEQIKTLENYDLTSAENIPNKNLIDELTKRCRRSLDAFALKHIPARIIFVDADWTMYSNEYNKTIQKFHETCKHYFDELAFRGLKATIIFDGTDDWKIETTNNSDLPKQEEK